MITLLRFLFLLLIMTKVSIAQFTSGGTKKGIDEIHSANELDLILNPTGAIKVPYFSGEFALVSGTLKEIEESVTTKDELSYVSGVTSSIQDQIDNFDASPLTTKGDIYVYSSMNDRLGIGTAGQILAVDLAEPTGLKWIDVPVSLPDQTGNAGKSLTTNGTTSSWVIGEKLNAKSKDNLSTNPSFENAGDLGVVSVGSGFSLSGTTTRTLQATAHNSTKYNVLGSASDTLSWSRSYSADYSGRQMVAVCEVKNRRANTKIEMIVDGITIGEKELQANDLWEYIRIPFVGGATTQEIKIDGYTASTDDWDVDNCDLKISESEVQEVSGANFTDKLHFAETNCEWTKSTAGWGKSTVDADCLGSSLNGNVSKLPSGEAGLRILNAKAGMIYKITANVNQYNDANASACLYSLSTSASYEDQGAHYNEGSSSRVATGIAGVFKATNSGVLDIYHIINPSAAVACGIYGAPTLPLAYFVEEIPEHSNLIVTQDTELTKFTVNVLTADFSSTAVELTNDYDWIDSSVHTATGEYTIDYTSLALTTIPVISSNDNSSAHQTNCKASLATLTQVLIVCNRHDTNIRINRVFNVTLHKQLTDVNKSKQLIGNFSQIRSDDLVLVEAEDNDSDAIAVGEDIPFKTTVRDDNNLWTNIGNTGANTKDAFTAPKTADYDIDFSANHNSGTPQFIPHINGVEYKSRKYTHTATIISQFTWLAIPLNEGDVLTFRFNSAFTLVAHTTWNKLRIIQRADKESIVQNFLKDNHEKCQTRFLSADVSTNGVIGDLGFANLDTSKLHRIDIATLINGSVAVDNINLTAKVDSVIVCRNQASRASSSSVPSNFESCVFKPSISTLIMDVSSISAGNYLAGNGTITETRVTLCQQPKTTIFTTEF